MTDSKWGEENGQDESATSCYTRKQGSYERLLEQCQKKLEANEGITIQKDNISIKRITAMNRKYNLCLKPMSG